MESVVHAEFDIGIPDSITLVEGVDERGQITDSHADAVRGWELLTFSDGSSYQRWFDKTTSTAA